MINQFNSNIAVKFNINTAIFVQELAQWTFYNLVNKHNIHDGLCWSFNSLEAYTEIFPYWTRRQLETVINNAIKDGLVAKGNYNKHKYDRTCWYALTYEALSYFPELTKETYLITLSQSISQNGELYDKNLTHDENAYHHFTKLCEAFHRTVTAIPSTFNSSNVLSNKKTLDKTPSGDGDAGNPDIQPKLDSKKSLDLQDLISDNPHDIPKPMLEDWVIIRKGKKAKITRTAWLKVNKTLSEIEKAYKIKPIESFERMVANCWLSLETKYFKDESKSNGSHNSIKPSL